MNDKAYRFWSKILWTVGLAVSVLLPILTALTTMLNPYMDMLILILALHGLVIGSLMVYKKKKLDQMMVIVLLAVLAISTALSAIPYLGSFIHGIFMYLGILVGGSLVIPALNWIYNRRKK